MDLSDYSVNQLQEEFKALRINHNTGTIIVNLNNNEETEESKTVWSNTVNVVISNNSGSVIVGEDNIILVSPRRLPIPEIKQIQAVLLQYCSMKNAVHHYRCNGRWDDFYNEAGVLLSREQDVTTKILVMIETGSALTYQNDFKNAKKKLNEAISLIRNTTDVKAESFLLVFALCRMSTLQRKTKKIWKATNSVHIISQNIELLPFNPHVKLFLAYEKSSTLIELFNSLSFSESDKRERILKNAKRELHTCISIMEKLLLDSSLEFCLHDFHFLLLKSVSLNLQCGTRESRLGDILGEDPHKSRQEAKDCLSKMETKYNNSMSQITQLRLCIAKCDLFFRQRDYKTAKTFALQALDQAGKYNFPLEVQPIQERLTDICQGLSGGSIAGIVIAVIIVMILIAVTILVTA